MSKVKSKKSAKPRKVDWRQQLFNEGKLGPIAEIQVSAERITKLQGILFDLDPSYFRKGGLMPKFGTTPDDFYDHVVRDWLSRHPVLNKCEVRMSGTGLHAILWVDTPIGLEDPADHQHWIEMVKVIQAALPIDPGQPGITATTRARNSVNSKNRAVVKQMAEGQKVTREELQTLCDDMLVKPFRTVFQVLTGKASVTPCPRCGKEGTKLTALDHIGQCYGSCGKVKLDDLYGLVLAERE